MIFLISVKLLISKNQIKTPDTFRENNATALISARRDKNTKTYFALFNRLLALIFLVLFPLKSFATPFACTGDFYQVLSGQLHVLDYSDGTYSPIGAGPGMKTNAAGYNTQDNYIYALGINNSIKKHLIRYDSTGQTVSLGNVGISSTTGDMNRNNELCALVDASGFKCVNVTTLAVRSILGSLTLPKALDIVHIPSGGNEYYYGVHNGNLYRYDATGATTTESLTTIQGLPSVGDYGAAYTDSSDNLYVSDNAGGLYRIDDYNTANPTATLLTSSGITKSNDGASCPLAALIDAIDDDFSATPVNSENGGTTASVVTADTLGGTLNPTIGTAQGDVTLNSAGTTQDGTTTLGLDTTPTNGGITMNSAGELVVAPNTTVGTYTYTYEICEVANPANCDTAVATLIVEAAAAVTVDLKVTKMVDDSTPNIGDTVTFSLLVENLGPSTATAVSVTDIVPAGFTYVPDSMTGITPTVSGITADQSSPIATPGLSWIIDTLTVAPDAGSSTTLTFQAVIKAP